jgi:hypothetical protein
MILDTGLRRYDIIAGFMWLCRFHGLSNGYAIASSAFGLLAMTNGAFFEGF